MGSACSSANKINSTQTTKVQKVSSENLKKAEEPFKEVLITSSIQSIPTQPHENEKARKDVKKEPITQKKTDLNPNDGATKIKVSARPSFVSNTIRNQTPLVKIVATLGPASSDPAVLAELIKAGVNVIRLNFSHGVQDDHKKLYSTVRDVAKQCGIEVAIMVDLQGPKIRCNTFPEGSITLTRGQKVTIVNSKEPGSPGIITTNFKELVERCKDGDEILMDDGLLMLKVSGRNTTGLICDVIVGGVLKNRKGINLPHTDLGELPALTEKDIKDAKFALEFLDPDFLALSFVRKAKDVLDLRDIINSFGKKTKIVVKIEKPQAMDNLVPILEVTDAAMVARGDLGVECGNEKVPGHQKNYHS